MPVFGLNLLLWRPALWSDPVLLDRLAELGYDGVEIPVDPATPDRYQGLGDALRRRGLRCTCTGRGIPGAHLVSSQTEERKAGLDRIERMLDIAEDLGAEVLAGPLFRSPGFFTGGFPTPEEIARAANGLGKASDSASRREILLCPEILNRFESHLVNTVRQALDLARRIDHPAYGIHYDTFHAHIEERSPAGAIQEAGPHIRHVHFAENDRGIPGTGQVDWRSTVSALHAIDYQGWIVAEGFALDEPMLMRSMHLWREVYPSQQIYAETALPNMRRLWNERGRI